jgi:hypothetical protein
MEIPEIEVDEPARHPADPCLLDVSGGIGAARSTAAGAH